MTCLALAASISGCSLLVDPVLCTDEIRPALIVEVRDSVSGEFVGPGARVTAVDGSFIETVVTTSEATGYALAHERAGNYTITAEQEGYQLWRRDGVRVTRDECHVRTVYLTARLKR